MPGGKKSETQRETVAFKLAGGWTIKRTAARCGVSERTIRNWSAETAFVARVRELRGRLLTRTVARLAAAGVSAVRTLVKLTGEGQKGNVRVSAADKILNHMLRGVQMIELEARLAELEARLAAQDGGKP